MNHKPDTALSPDSHEAQTALKQDRDFYYDELGRFVLTETYLKQRGTCCENGCRHCPYGFKKNDLPPVNQTTSTAG